MQTQKDHVDADRFQALRVADAVTFGHVLHLETRARRAGLGLVVGAVIAVLVGVGVGIFGLLKPGGATSWRAAGAIIMDRDTGTRMIYRDGRLHAVRNYASAVLAEGKGSHVVQVASASIDDVPLGPRIGIDGAPDSVPSTLATGRWLLCASVAGADAAAHVTVLVDGAGSAEAVGDDRYVLVRDSSGRRWVLAGAHRYRVADDLVPLVLGLQTSTVPVVPSAWLAAVPLGVKLARPSFPGAGEPGPEVARKQVDVGSLFVYTAANGRTEGLVALRDGLASVPRTEFALLRAHTDRVTELSAADVADAPRAEAGTSSGLPDLVGQRATVLSETPVCMRQRSDGTTEPTLRTVPQAALGRASGTPPALTFRLDVGQGVYAAATDATGSAVTSALQSAPRYLITGDGMKYPLMTKAAADALGYSNASPRPVPPALLDLLPTGPRLSRAAVGSTDD